MAWLGWILALAAALAAGSALALWSYGRFARRAQGPDSLAIPPGQGAPLDRALAPLEADHPGQSGAAFVFDPHEAFHLRLRSAAMAMRSLDLLYYIWTDDLTGRLLAQALVEAADRGVRVRLLLDDVNVLGRDPTYLALDRHANIEVRLFNPIRARESALRRGIELLFNLVRYNRRMHGKIWLVDGRVALVGGRNVGDAYFGAARGRRRNVDDLEMLLAGPVLGATASLFDDYWNSGLALPIRSLWHKRKTSLARFRTRLRRDARSPAARAYLERAMPAGSSPGLPLERLRWAGRLELVADPPQKALGSRRAGWLPASVMPLLLAARRDLRIMTPYFVPGTDGLAALIDLATRGVRIEIITNALAVADHVLVHGAYRWYRRALIDAGITLFEFAARPARRRGGRQLMLHGKAMIVDGELGFVGSFNFDLRSAYLNTEMGVIFDDPQMLGELNTRLDWATGPEQAYRLGLDGRLMAWLREGEPPLNLEPQSSMPRRVLSFLIGHLPIHRLL
ncbi:MAG: phospholipase D-like domain-containing protein [Pararhodobacter sp.]